MHDAVTSSFCFSTWFFCEGLDDGLAKPIPDALVMSKYYVELNLPKNYTFMILRIYPKDAFIYFSLCYGLPHDEL